MPLKVPTITDLDSSQRKVVEHMPYNDPMFVNGPPGSGKTHLAILRLQVLLNEGYTNVLFLLYNHSMYGFLKSIFNKMGMRTNVNIETKDFFFTQLARGGGYSFSNESRDFKDYALNYSRRLSFILGQSDLPRFPIIVIDECQDFSDEEITILRRLSDKILAVGDIDQTVYKNAVSPFFRSLPTKKLETIYRYGKKVARIAQPFSKSGEKLEDKVSVTNDTDVYRVKATDNRDAIDKIARILDAKKSTDMTIGILGLTKNSLSNLQSELDRRRHRCSLVQDNNGMRDYDFDTKTPILITPFSAKGMEFDCVILYGYDRLLDLSWYQPLQKELIYVSLTRTCNELYLIQEPGTHRLLTQLGGWQDIDNARPASTQVYDF